MSYAATLMEGYRGLGRDFLVSLGHGMHSLSPIETAVQGAVIGSPIERIAQGQSKDRIPNNGSYCSQSHHCGVPYNPMIDSKNDHNGHLYVGGRATRSKQLCAVRNAKKPGGKQVYVYQGGRTVRIPFIKRCKMFR